MTAPRRLPRISGTLNNCAVHAVVPEIMEQIVEFALLEEQEVAVPENVAYQKLKNLFAEYYELQDLTWKKLKDLLTESVNNNPLAQQLVLGPVLRDFMRSEAPAVEDYNVIDTAQAAARYALLDAKQLSEHLCKPLNIPLICHEAQPLATNGYVIAKHEFKSQHETVHVYNEGNDHWERYSSTDVKSQAVDGKSTLARDCMAISKVHQVLSEGHTADGLELLKTTVKGLYDHGIVQEMKQSQAQAQEKSIPAPTQKEIVDINVARAMSEYAQRAQKSNKESPEVIKDKLKKLYSDILEVDLDSNSENPDEKLAKELQKEELKKFRP